MKRRAAWALLAAVLLGGLAGCGNSDQPAEATRPLPSNRFPGARPTPKKAAAVSPYTRPESSV
jgi:hypothetical protein